MFYDDESIRAIAPADLRPRREINNVPVVIASSNFFAPYAGVYLQSLIDHASPENSYDIIIMEREISRENRRLLLSLSDGRENISIRFCDPRGSLPDLPEDLRYPSELYYRVLSPHLLCHFERLVTTGVDMLLQADIANLFKSDLRGASLGAVRAWTINAMYHLDIPRGGYPVRAFEMGTQDYFHKVLRLKDASGYINADAIVYDAGKFRKEHSIEKLLSLIQRDDLIWVDQDVINIAAQGRIALLPLTWNFEIISAHQADHMLSVLSVEEKADLVQASKAPSLLHWAGKPKPWVCPDVPFGSEWWTAARRTPFMGHILARMIDELQKRGKYYQERYGQDVPVWEPIPQVDRSKKYQ